MGDSIVQYVLVRGGLVQEAPPRTAVFDLDVLDSYPVVEGQVGEVQDLLQRMGQFSDVLGKEMDECLHWLYWRCDGRVTHQHEVDAGHECPLCGTADPREML